jgi:hypothetical protein
MRRSLHGTPAAGVACILAAAAVLMSAAPGRAGGFVETFADDPVAAGRFVLADGPETAGRFVHEAPGAMKAHYDTRLATARLVRPLGRTLTAADAFTCRATLTIQSQGFFADTTHIAQIAFGLMNTQTTGIDRVYGSQGGAYDLVSFDYYPNLTSFGGPSLGPTIINSYSSSKSFPASINFTFGPETASDPAYLQIPQDVLIGRDEVLTVELRYEPATRRLMLRVFRDGPALNINNVGKNYVLGGSDGDPTTIITQLTGVGFSVDAFGILLWRDYSSSTSSVIADVVYNQVEVSWPSFGDFDGDGDVDEDDYALFEECASGPGVSLAAGCGMRDGDGDGDVDQSDFGKFQAMLTGPR